MTVQLVPPLHRLWGRTPDICDRLSTVPGAPYAILHADGHCLEVSLPALALQPTLQGRCKLPSPPMLSPAQGHPGGTPGSRTG